MGPQRVSEAGHPMVIVVRRSHGPDGTGHGLESVLTANIATELASIETDHENENTCGTRARVDTIGRGDTEPSGT